MKYPVILGRVISIHALLAESDWVLTGGLNSDGYFYPRSPCGERPSRTENEGPSFCISIHALLAESDDNKPTQRAG